jgi:hypothetical protein
MKTEEEIQTMARKATFEMMRWNHEIGENPDMIHASIQWSYWRGAARALTIILGIDPDDNIWQEQLPERKSKDNRLRLIRKCALAFTFTAGTILMEATMVLGILMIAAGGENIIVPPLVAQITVISAVICFLGILIFAFYLPDLSIPPKREVRQDE